MAEEKQEKQQAKSYGSVNILLSFLFSAFTIGLSVLLLPEYIGLNPSYLPFYIPIVAGLVLALVNISYIGVWNALLLPALFAFCFGISFSLLLYSMEGQIGGESALKDFLIEQVPALFASYILYRGYTLFSGQSNILIGLLVVLLGQAAMYALFRDYDAQSLQVIYYTLLNTLLSILHFGQKK